MFNRPSNTQRDLPKPKFKSVNYWLINAIKQRNLKDVKLSLNAGADPNYYIDEEGQYVLFLAFAYDEHILNTLIEHPKIDLQITDGEGKTILHHLAKYDMFDIIAKLLPVLDIEAKDDHNHTPLTYAIINRKPHTIRLLLECYAYPNNNDIKEFISWSRDLNLFQILLNNRGQLNFSDHDIRKWVIYSIKFDNEKIFSYLYDQYSIRFNKFINYTNSKGMSLLHHTRNVEIIEKLLTLGADPNMVNVDGDPPINMLDNDDIDLIKLYLKYQADLTIINVNGKTSKEVLIANGVDISLI